MTFEPRMLPPTFSFFRGMKCVYRYVVGELSRGYLLERDEAMFSEKQRRVVTFMKTPRELEKVCFKHTSIQSHSHTVLVWLVALVCTCGTDIQRQCVYRTFILIRYLFTHTKNVCVCVCVCVCACVPTDDVVWSAHLSRCFPLHIHLPPHSSPLSPLSLSVQTVPL